MVVRAAIGLGANLGDKAGQLREALDRVAALPECELKVVSPFYRTEPVGLKEQDWFVNAAALVDTTLSARRLLEDLLAIENAMGRVRTLRWGPRVIDLDLLFYGSEVIDEPELAVPHPFLEQRRFVLAPLADISPRWRHPLLGLTVRRLLAQLPADGQGVSRL